MYFFFSIVLDFNGWQSSKFSPSWAFVARIIEGEGSIEQFVVHAHWKMAVTTFAGSGLGGNYSDIILEPPLPPTYIFILN